MLLSFLLNYQPLKYPCFVFAPKAIIKDKEIELSVAALRSGLTMGNASLR